MGRNATIYWKNRETGQIEGDFAGRAYCFEAQPEGKWLCYAGQFDEVHWPTEWVRFEELTRNLSRVVLANNGDEKHRFTLEYVLDLCRPHSETCDFYLHTEEGELPEEIEKWLEEKRRWVAQKQADEEARRKVDPSDEF